jgi:hypothetical protein
MAAIGIVPLCVEARALCTGEGSVSAVVKRWVGHFLLDLVCNVLDCIHPPLGQLALRWGREAELQRDLDYLVQGQWQVDLPTPRLLHG